MYRSQLLYLHRQTNFRYLFIPIDYYFSALICWTDLKGSTTTYISSNLTHLLKTNHIKRLNQSNKTKKINNN